MLTDGKFDFLMYLTFLVNQLGRDIVKDVIRLKQVRDIFGIRAVDEIRQELNISS